MLNVFFIDTAMKPFKIFLLTGLVLALLPFLRLSAEVPVLPAQDSAAITRRMGEVTTVEGVVHNIFWVRNQTLMITFQEERGGFVAVSFARHRNELNEAFGGDVVQHLRGRNVRITGEIAEHQYRPQIVVRSPDQIQLP
jgi:DNA/RNA endonuclease YhcR with UshA esterase domain